MTHPYSIAELALCNLRARQRTLLSLDCLPTLAVVTLAEVRAMIEARHLFGIGIGLIDAHLIASCLATPGCALWTRDRHLAKAAHLAGVLLP